MKYFHFDEISVTSALEVVILATSGASSGENLKLRLQPHQQHPLQYIETKTIVPIMVQTSEVLYLLHSNDKMTAI